MLPRWLKRKREDKFSHYRRFLVLDIETVPDGEMMDSVMEEKERERYREGEFIHPAYHRVVAISVMRASGGDVEDFCSCASGDESALLMAFWRIFADSIDVDDEGGNFPVLITVNGKGFDIPVILLRSLKHAHDFGDRERKAVIHFTDMSADRFDMHHPNYGSPFTRYHIDLARDVFGHRVSLRKLAYLSGIPVKVEGKGEEVASYFLDGDLERIARYCAEDVKVTALVFSRINRFLYGFLYGDFPSFGRVRGANPRLVIE